MEGLSSFLERIVMHPTFGATLQKVVSLVTGIARPGLIQVFGPPGVGKTELGKQIAERVRQHYHSELADNPGALPALRIVVPPPIDSTFDFRSYYREGLREFHEPLLDQKERVGSVTELSQYEKRQLRRTGWELRDAFVSCIQYRSTQVVINDEAQHFNKARGARRLVDHMDTMKTLSDQTGAVFVLLGTYELLDALEVSGQLARRSRTIHFTRYRAQITESVKVFKGVLHTLQNHLPVPTDIGFADNWEYFYRMSLGLVGRLKDHLNQALSAAVQAGAKRLVWEHLKMAEPSNAELRKLLVEIEEGEQRRTQEESWDAELTRKLGIPVVNTNESVATGQQPSKPRRRPGERAPSRDPVGAL